MIDYSWLLVAIPLTSAGLLLLLGNRANKWGHLLATLAVAASFVVGLLLILQVLGAPSGAGYCAVTTSQWWLETI